MESFEQKNACPRCDYPFLKRWDELTEDERFVAARLLPALDDAVVQRKQHRVCTRCWFVDRGADEQIA